MSSPQAQTTAELVKSIVRVDPPPCDYYGCPERANCAAHQMACYAFAYFISTGTLVGPRTLFRNGRPIRSVYLDATHRTREIFDAVYPKDDFPQPK